MLGTVIVFLAIMVAVLWYLMDGADEDKDSHEKREPRRGNGRKKSRRKGLRRGGKRVATESQPTKPPAAGPSTSTRESVKTSSRTTQGMGTSKTSMVLNSEDWPSLRQGQDAREPGGRGRGSSQPQEHVLVEEEEEDLAALHAAMLKASKSVDRSATGSPEIAASGGGGRIGVGDRVEAQFQAGVEWFPAIVTKTLHGGLLNVLYDDGERETRIEVSRVRRPGAASAESSDSEYNSDPDVPRDPVKMDDRGPQRRKEGGGWEVVTQKVKKTSQERVESRTEANSNLKNRSKRQKKREKELAAREALRKNL